MCEQTEMMYLEGDIVWVKLGACWWPGEVKDFEKMEDDIKLAFKKPPIAVVKFFQEDKFEYVKNLNNIYKYNCRRKNDFIKKGLEMYRKDNPFMEKFPSDVTKAEELTHGDPNIISSDMFLPEQKTNYAQIFGTPSPKKTPKLGGARGRSSLSTRKNTPKSADRMDRRIFHPRFVGKSDFGVTYLEQQTSAPVCSHYTCHICGFVSTRLNVIVLHNKSHSSGYISNTIKKPVKKYGRKISKTKFANTTSIDEDIQLIRQGFQLSGSESEDEPEETEKAEAPAKRQKSQKTKVPSPKKSKASPSAICSNLLAEWGDSDADEQENKEEPQKKDTKESEKISNDLLADWDVNSDDEKSDLKKPAEEKPETNENGKDCFDFKEEEEQTVLQKSPGRKIPRVIPQKRKSIEKISEEKVQETDPKSLPEEIEPPIDNQKETEEDESTFKNLLEETTVPDLPSIELKSSQNFQMRKPIKSPDKKEDSSEKTNGVFKESDSISECPIPKKRFTRNFEDFEMFHNEQKVDDKPEDPADSPSKSNLEVAKLKTQLMTKLNDQSVSSPAKPTTSPVQPRPRKGRRKSKLIEKKDEIDDIEVRKDKVIEEDIFLNDSVAETSQQPIEAKAISTESAQISSEEKAEIFPEAMETALLPSQIKMDTSQDAIPKEETKRQDIIEDIMDCQTQEIEQPIVQDIAPEPPSIQEEVPLLQEKPSQEIIEPIQIEKEDIFQDTAFPDEITQEAVIPEENVQETAIPEEITQQETSIPEEIAQEERSIPEEIMQEPAIPEEIMQETQMPQEIMQEDTPIPEEIAQEETAIPEVAQEETATPETAQKDTAIPEIAQEESAIPEIAQEETAIPEEIVQEEAIQETMVQEELVVHEETIVHEEKAEDLIQEQNSSQTDEEKPKMVMDIADIHIDNTDNLSGLTTLAAVSELTGLFDPKPTETVIEEPPVEKEEIITEQPIIEEIVQESPKPEEIPLPESPKKVATLANFSMDFSDSNESIPLKKEETQPVQTLIHESRIPIEETITETVITDNIQDEITTAGDFPPFCFMEENVVHEEYVEKIEPEKPETLESEMAKLTNTHPGSENSEVMKESHNTSSSKLLEILTESKGSKKMITTPKTLIQSSSKQNMVLSSDKGLVKFDKNSRFVIKSAKTPKSNKPIILSEKIIKPVTETETVSVKKVTSKRTYQDVEDIDTFIIQKPAKKSNTSDDMHDIILTPKSELKHIKGRGSGARGKPKIIEQTIIKAADVPGGETGPLLDDSMFDINSMPIVLSDQILTPESIENMQVITDMIPGVSSTPTPVEKPTVAPLKRGGTLQQVKLLNKAKITPSQPEVSNKVPNQPLVKSVIPRALGKNQKVYASSTKLLKSNPAVITQPGKPGKFIILPTTTASTSTGSKYTVGKRLGMKTDSPTSSKGKVIQGLSNEPSGNKIMIVTNNQGVQSRVLLTPAQQKVLAGKMPTTKITKGQTPIKSQTQVKGNLIHPKSILTSKGTLVPVSTMATPQKQLVTQAIMTSKGQIISTQNQTLVTSEGQVLTPLTPQQLRSIKSDAKGRRIQPGQRIILPDKSLETTPKGKMVISSGKKTILLKGPPGHTYKKVIDSPESKTLFMSGQKHMVQLSGQQLQQAGVSGKQLVVTSKGQLIKTDKMTMSKAGEKVNIQRVSKTPTRITKGKSQMMLSPTVPKSTIPTPIVPPLAPITSQAKKHIEIEAPKVAPKEIKEKEPAPVEQKHLIIQDNLGNQTTVTEGQILALPRETVDGQPQSYMLVTVDESGNLAPLSNEALMSLEPGLTLGGDMNNLVLQFDQPGAETQAKEVQPEVPQTEVTTEQQVVSIDGQQIILDQTQQEQQIPEAYSEVAQEVAQPEQQTLQCNISTGETSQQLIITGDPESTQKFLASLSEGNTDLSSLLTGAEGNIIINTDGQQILLNTGDPDNQILLQMPSTSEMSQNAMEMTQTTMFDNQIKNQDILAAALADTDVFQQDAHEKLVTQEIKASTSQLSPSAMYPMSVGNVLETSLTLGAPIMTPLEVPSSKKVKLDLESTLMTQVPTSLELPITITDPNISQTVSQQVLLSNELQSNLELPISVSDTITSIQSTEMNSPSYVYSLPSLDESSEIKTTFSESVNITSENIYNNSLTGSMSMPLLTEEPIETGVCQVESEVPTVESEMTHIETSLPSVETEITQIEPNLTQVESEITQMEPNLTLVETEVTQMEPNLTSGETEVTQMEPNLTSVEPEVTEMEPNLTSVETEVTQMEPNLTSVEPEVMQMDANLTSVETKVTQMEPNLTPVESEVIQMEANLTSVETEVTQMEPNLTPVDSEITHLEPTEPLESETSHVQPEIPHMEPDLPKTTQVEPDLEPPVPPVDTELTHVEPEIQVEPEIPQVEPEIPQVEPEIPVEHVEPNIPEVASETPTEEPSMVEQEPISVATEEKIEDMTPITPEIPLEKEIEPEPTTSFAESLRSPSFDSDIHESVEEMTKNISSAIEDDLDLQTSDMCDSLSEPPPGMFEKSSFLTDSYLNKPEDIPVCDIPLPDSMPSVSNERKNKNMEFSNLSNSGVSSPQVDMDESSCEIPVHPQIITHLTENIELEFGCRKRESEQIYESDSKRTKLSD